MSDYYEHADTRHDHLDSERVPSCAYVGTPWVDHQAAYEVTFYNRHGRAIETQDVCAYRLDVMRTVTYARGVSWAVTRTYR